MASYSILYWPWLHPRWWSPKGSKYPEQMYLRGQSVQRSGIPSQILRLVQNFSLGMENPRAAIGVVFSQALVSPSLTIAYNLARSLTPAVERWASKWMSSGALCRHCCESFSWATYSPILLASSYLDSVSPCNLKFSTRSGRGVFTPMPLTSSFEASLETTKVA